MRHFRDGLFIDKDLNKFELDALLVVILRKAPHGVLQQRLLLVLLKVVEGKLSHVRKAKTCGTGLREDELHRLVAQYVTPLSSFTMYVLHVDRLRVLTFTSRFVVRDSEQQRLRNHLKLLHGSDQSKLVKRKHLAVR